MFLRPLYLYFPDTPRATTTTTTTTTVVRVASWISKRLCAGTSDSACWCSWRSVVK